MTYIKLTGTKIGHMYKVEYYDVDGLLVDSGYEYLKDIDKRCPRHTKLRLSGNVWGRVTESGRILPVNLPKFLKLTA